MSPSSTLLMTEVQKQPVVRDCIRGRKGRTEKEAEAADCREVGKAAEADDLLTTALMQGSQRRQS